MTASIPRSIVARRAGRPSGSLAASFALLGIAMTPVTLAGPYPPAAGRPGSDAIAADDPRILGWAVEAVALVRGAEEIADPFSLPASYGSATSALGRADVAGNQDQPEPGSQAPKPAVSLGDGGSITLRFDPPIADGPGPDLAVFENGISFNGGGSFFMELAFVEVSSDGVTFTQFPAFSESPVTPQIGSYGAIDPSDVHNLAGKYLAGFGTPFDLAELPGTPGQPTHPISHVRIVDVVGSINPLYARRDSLDRIINDPWPTFLTTSGFDLDAVAVLHQADPTYEAWRAQVAWGAQSASPEADPDADGMPNLVEYAFDLNPVRSDAAPLLEISLTDDGWVAVAPPPRNLALGLEITLETTTDMRTWTSHVGSKPVRLGPANEGAVVARLRCRLLPLP